MLTRKICFILASALCALLLVSCGESPDNRNHPLLIKARANLDSKNYENSVRYYEIYLRNFPNSAKVHADVAAVYDENLNDPLMAIYHYRKCLENGPSSQDAETVNKWMDSAEKKYYLKIKAKFLERISQAQPSAASKTVDEPKTSSPSSASKPSAASQPKIRYYTVKDNDNLQRISSEVYGTSKYYDFILKSNQDILPSERKLKPGQKLRILPIPESARK